MIIFKKLCLVLVSITTAGIFLSSCDKNDPVATAPSLESFLSNNAELSIFNAAVNKAGLKTFKEGGGPFTWFAPNNTAFTSAGITLDSVGKMTEGAANYLVTYHLLNASFGSINMIAQNSFPRTTQQGSSVYIGRNGNTFFINGSQILSADQAVANGLVHIINRVNTPPQLVGNLQNILTKTGAHTLFIAALTKANRWTQLSTASVFTVLAPTDAAMTNAGLDSTAIAGATRGKVDSIVRYHYFNSLRYFSNDFGTKQTPQTALGSGRTITSLENGAKLKGKTNVTPANVIKTDLLGTNGVVHIIDGVLSF